MGLAPILLALSCRIAGAQTPAPAEQAPTRASEVARIVSGIVNFTRWPGEPRDVRLCITTPAAYADALTREMSASTRLASVQYFAPEDARLDSSCDVVYIEQIDDANHSDLFRRLAKHPVLSITGFDSGCLMGSLFCISGSGSPVTFSANLDAISRSGLRINPKVLFLVHRQPAK